MAPGTLVTAAVFARFGEQFRLPDGSLDRRALGRLVFSDPESLAALESIVHPAINELLDRIVRETGDHGPQAMALEAVKLVEAGHAEHCDEVWLITCDPAAQLARLVGRGMSKFDALQRIEAQAPSLPLWQAAATRTIGTDGSRQEVESAVARALDEALARHR
jgi:dephospho-CoA kinase